MQKKLLLSCAQSYKKIILMSLLSFKSFQAWHENFGIAWANLFWNVLSDNQSWFANIETIAE